MRWKRVKQALPCRAQFETFDFNLIITMSSKSIMPENVVDTILFDLSFFLNLLACDHVC